MLFKRDKILAAANIKKVEVKKLLFLRSRQSTGKLTPTLSIIGTEPSLARSSLTTSR